MGQSARLLATAQGSGVPGPVTEPAVLGPQRAGMLAGYIYPECYTTRHLPTPYLLVSVTNDCGRRRPIVAQRRMPLSSIHQNTCDDTASVAI